MEPTEKEVFMEATYISIAFLNDLREWVSEGNRTVEIKIKKSDYSSDKPLSIWAYDSDVVTSAFIEKMEDIPTVKETLEKKLRQAEEDVVKLKKKLKEKE